MITILSTEEHEDGTATMVVEMEKDTRELLVEYAIVELLKKHLRETEETEETEEPGEIWKW
mgnify:FL=1